MGEDIEQRVDTNSAEFKQGVEAGLNSEEDAKNWEAGYELGQALKGAGETRKPARETRRDESATPLFLRGGADGHKGNAQDEKDLTGE